LSGGGQSWLEMGNVLRDKNLAVSIFPILHPRFWWLGWKRRGQNCKDRTALQIYKKKRKGKGKERLFLFLKIEN